MDGPGPSILDLCTHIEPAREVLYLMPSPWNDNEDASIRFYLEFYAPLPSKICYRQLPSCKARARIATVLHAKASPPSNTRSNPVSLLDSFWSLFRSCFVWAIQVSGAANIKLAGVTPALQAAAITVRLVLV